MYDNEYIESGATIEDLVERDEDQDGTPDWQEALLGETTQNAGSGPEEESGLNQTDKFSREFFSTVASLNQSGAINESSIAALGASLAERMQNSSPRKIYRASDIKITDETSTQAVKKYRDAMEAIYKKYPARGNVVEIFGEFLGDGENVNTVALSDLTPITEQMKKIIAELQKTSVPRTLAPLHLNFLNTFQRLLENTEDMKFYETDVVVALSGMGRFEENIAAFETASLVLEDAIAEKVNN